jgi:hypothetical protein
VDEVNAVQISVSTTLALLAVFRGHSGESVCVARACTARAGVCRECVRGESVCGESVCGESV